MFSIKVNGPIRLELISYARSKELFSLIEKDREYLSQWLAWPNYVASEKQYNAFIKRSLIEYTNEESLVFHITYNDKAIGSAGFIEIKKDLEKGEIGYWISESMQGKGIATAVLKKLVEIGFDELSLSKIEASVAVENEKSQLVCERVGMEVEGVISHSERINNSLISHKKYAVFSKEFSQ